MDAIIPAVLKAALTHVVKRAVEQPQGAALVRDPMRVETVVLPGQRPSSDLGENLADKIVEKTEARLRHLRDGEFRKVPDGEWAAAVEAASCTVRAVAPITIADAIGMDLLPDAIAGKAIAADPYRVQAAGLGENGAAVYRRVVAESCAHIVEFLTTRPGFEKQLQIDLVRSTRAVHTKLDALAEQPSREDAAFERRYADAVRRRLDSIQMFGVTLRHDRPYSLATAYLGLGVMAESADVTGVRLRVEEALAGQRRVLIRGEAGCGKTTLLQWLAVTSLGEDATVPFLIPLRRFAGPDLPLPDQFCDEISPALAREAPPGWVRRVLDDGRALVLIDGVDELPARRRQEVWRWLRDLVGVYDKARFVITSRPPAADCAFLAPEGFQALMMLPMNQADVHAFVRQWHAAMSEAVAGDEHRAALVALEDDLLAKLAQRRDLRRLATNPLLCAVICALHLDRYRQLPRDRMGLYHAALEMLLVRRDEARAIVADEPQLSQSDQEALLAQLAYWLVRNDRSEAPQEEAQKRLEKYLASLPHIQSAPEEVLDQLALRSGVLRRPVSDRVDFLHKTFQEYLAAKALLDEGDLDALIQNAHQDQWREVTVMAVGHARRKEREYILRGLLHRADSTPEVARVLYLLAASCLTHAVTVDRDLVELVKARVAALIPPQSLAEVDQLASAGEMVLDLIPDPGELSETEGIHVLQVLHRFPIEDTVAVFARLATSGERGVRAYISTQWPTGACDEYADVVLSGMPLDDLVVKVSSDRQLRAAARLPGMTRLIAHECAGGVDSLAGHQELAELVLSHGRADGLAGLGGCPKLERLLLHECRLDAPLDGLADSALRELALFGPAATAGLPALDRLTLGPKAATVLDGGDGAVRHLSLVSSPWMLAASSAGAEWLPHLVQPSTALVSWRRPALLPLRNWTWCRELTIAGWPTPEELAALAGLTELATLRVIIATDPMRRSLIAEGAKYPYPPFRAGYRQTARALPQLRRIEILAFDRDRLAGLFAGQDPSPGSGPDGAGLVLDPRKTHFWADPASSATVVVNGAPVAKPAVRR
ncbi:NACHT domain-containing protein [Actinoplanes sp. CA-142083]|uniref:NACHT domain-containing protein n=1 Tax=Actinoplanes sp. CA-142083 TaxID=3239903 RepID=UPI003D8D9156